jgi:hypothetical protein
MISGRYHALACILRVKTVNVYIALPPNPQYFLRDEGDLKTIRIRVCARVPAEEIGRFEERLHEEALGEDF